MDEDDAVMLTDGVTELVVMVIELLVAFEVVIHEALDVITTLTTSPFEREEDVNDNEVAPLTSTPFTCHW